MDSSEASEKLVLHDLLVSFHGSLDEVDLIKKEGNDEYMKNCMGVNDETLQELHGVCDVSTLQCDGEPETSEGVMTRMEHFKSFPERDVNLVTLYRKKEENSQPEINGRYRSAIYKWSDEPVLHGFKSVWRNDPRCNIDTPDLIISVAVHSPFDASGQHGFKSLYVAGEYQVLGQQFLTDLRDKIECRCDKVPMGEFSDFPHKPPEMMSGDMYKSGFFFINNVFYDDLRDSSAIRYSDEIVNWAKKPGRGLPDYEQKDMEKTRFIDLTIKLGEAYVYQHQGKCEHLLTFQDVKLLHPRDCHDIAEYPLSVSKPLVSKTRSCCVCWNHASWVSVGFSLSPNYETYYCNTCFHAFHYDKDGKKISDFNAYRMIQ